ncbi:hypothetical protein CLOM_g13664 [Closterium sp. NIES-68]|nr:hypothetical protein CLOM_g13664 [Closterium sp. NIES-68]GJP85915.1 hypothetical protein CLOP_g16007 [Closterium sp. NIES-67]
MPYGDGFADSNSGSSEFDTNAYWPSAPPSLPAASDNFPADLTGDVSPAPAPAYTSSQDGGSLSRGAIVATVLGVVFGVFMLVVVVSVVVVRARNHERARAVSRGNYGDVNF